MLVDRRPGRSSRAGANMARKRRATREKDIDHIFREGTLIDEALAAGVQEALRRHKEAGRPIVEWRDGRTVWVPPEEIKLHQSTPNRRKVR